MRDGCASGSCIPHKSIDPGRIKDLSAERKEEVNYGRNSSGFINPFHGHLPGGFRGTADRALCLFPQGKKGRPRAVFHRMRSHDFIRLCAGVVCA